MRRAESGFLQRLDATAREASPTVLTMALVVVGVVPLRLPAFVVITPALALMGVYYWTMYRAELMPAATVFGIGLFQDILGGGPLGVNAFVLLLVHGAVMSQRRVLMRRPFGLGWIGFAAAALLGFVLNWLVMTALSLALFDPLTAAVQFVMTVALYPPFAWMFAGVQRAWVH